MKRIAFMISILISFGWTASFAQVISDYSIEDMAAICVTMTIRSHLPKEDAIWWIQFTTVDKVKALWAEQNTVLSTLPSADDVALVYDLWTKGAKQCAVTKAEALD